MPIGEVALVALIAGLVEVSKRAGLPARYAGLVAVLFGIAAVALVTLAGGEGRAAGIAQIVVIGAVYGLASAGLYSQGRSIGTSWVGRRSALDRGGE